MQNEDDDDLEKNFYYKKKKIHIHLEQIKNTSFNYYTIVVNIFINKIWNESLYFDNVYFDINNQSTLPLILLSVKI